MSRRLAASAALVAALAVGASTLTGCESDSPGTQAEGPVAFQADPEIGQYSSSYVDQGAQMVYGLLTVLNSGDDPATLTGAKLTGPPDEVADAGVTVSDVRVYDVTGGKEIVGADRWPTEPQSQGSVPLEGYQLAPDAEVELLFVVKVTKTGHWGWPQAQLDYEAGGTDYTIRIGAGYYVCPSTSQSCGRIK